MIGIFGDSFGHDSGKDSWPFFLKLLLDENIENHAVAASSLQFSINLFLKNHSKYDKVIFLTTNIPRLTLPVKCKSRNELPDRIFDQWAGLGQIEYALENYSSENNLLEKIFDYTVWISGDSSQNVYHNIMYNAFIVYIKSIRPDVILIPCFPTNGFDYYKEIGYTWSLYDISSHELQKLKSKNFLENDTRLNHLSEENNRWLANHVRLRLIGNFRDWNPDNSFQYTKTNKGK